MSSVLTPTNEPKEYAPSVDERQALQQQVDRVAEEKRLARLDPGPSWREWVFYDAMKWWLAVLLLIGDSLLIVQWFILGSAIGLALSLVAVVYAEFLLYRYLWTRPPPRSTRRRGPFHRTWYRPVEIGRWTPEADFARRHGYRPGTDDGPAPDEFL